MGVRNCGELGVNLQKIVSRLMANDNLVNLLYFEDKDPINHSPLADKEKQEKIKSVCEIWALVIPAMWW